MRQLKIQPLYILSIILGYVKLCGNIGNFLLDNINVLALERPDDLEKRDNLSTTQKQESIFLSFL